MNWVLLGFATVWVVGWLAALIQMLSFQKTPLGKAWVAIKLFVVWPAILLYIALER